MSQDLRQFFDLRKLDEQKLGMVEFVLNSPAYSETFKPYLLGIRDNMNELMLDRSQSRKDQMPDDYLAGAIAMIDGLLKFFTIIVHETNMERIHSSMAQMTPDRQYDAKAKAGRMKPVIGLDQSASPDEYRPEDDF